ncbi:MAG: PDZ domain-containing protein [Planctomycetes bacterium]|nr:PDZ domain-containing protein [Planctomycetota bacterium]
MNVHQCLSWAVAPALVAPLLVAPAQQEQSGLKRVAVEADVGAPAEVASNWQQRLTVGDLDQRERNYDAFVRALGNDPELRRTARAWTRDSNPELAWTVRLALRETRDVTPRRAGLGLPGAIPQDLRSRFDELERHFGDLDQMFEDLQRRMDHNPPSGLAPLPGVTRGLNEQRNYSVQVTPDGVKVEIEENVNGKVEKQIFEAKTLEELYELHPELKDKIGVRMPSRTWSGRGLTIPRWNGWSPFQNEFDADEDADLRPARPLQGGLPTDILGVEIGSPSDTERESLKLDAGVGLKVARVQADTIAHKIGVEAGDILVELNGRALKSAADVREVLTKRRANEDVAVTLYDPEGQRRTLTWRAPR